MKCYRLILTSAYEDMLFLVFRLNVGIGDKIKCETNIDTNSNAT